MKIRKINGLFWSVIENENNIYFGIGEDIKSSIKMCLQHATI